MSLSDRIRPNSEAAPWVIEEVKRLEADLTSAREIADRLSRLGETEATISPGFWGRIAAQQSARADRAEKELAIVRAENEQLRSILTVAACPNCDGQGWYPAFDRNGEEVEQVQCQWCAERTSLIP
jgi:hypothetical protein